MLCLAGLMRVIDAIWAFRYSGAIADQLHGALLGQSLKTYAWLWLIGGIVLIAAGILVTGPSNRPSAEVSRWIGIVAASLDAIGAIIMVPYYPIWALIYIAMSVMVIYGLAAHFDDTPMT